MKAEELIDQLKIIDEKKADLDKREKAIIVSLKNGSGGNHPKPTYP